MYINISKIDFGRCYSGGSGGGGEVVDLNYMTISALGDGEITITIPAGIKSTYATSLSYSKDKSTWTDNIVDNTAKTISIPATNGENVYLKGDALTWFDEEFYEGLNINSTANIDVSGNIMSLLYGDNFTDKTTLPERCTYNFGSLFSGNVNLINAKDLELPATTLENYCYSSMFEGCTSLTTAPALPATTLATYCYEYMFSGCTSLTTAPELPATTLATYCYTSMFEGCTSLTTAPELPVATLADGCYSSMFLECSSLTTAPELPATTLAQSCYSGMFADCTSFTNAPVLHATTLADSCYKSMFERCSSLTTAPELPATTLAQSCYQRMFQGCSNLNSITMLATDISATNCLLTWVGGVASTGTFTKAASMTSLPTGVDGIPSGWTVKDYTEYMTLSALGDGEITITIPAEINSTYATSLSYSKDKATWTETLIDDTAQTISIPVTSGENVYLKGIAKQLCKDYKSYININSTADINVSGNTMSLLYGDDYKDKVAFQSGSTYIFAYLFSKNTHLINADELILPATTLTNSCYSNMFDGCTSLTTAPELPATLLAKYCYSRMLNGCTSLTTATVLPATKLVDNCYYYMFQNCNKLNIITMLATDISAASCLYNWVRGVSSTGTFTKAASMTSLTTGESGIPVGWTVVDYGAA